MIETKRPRVAIHKPHVVKNCATRFFDNREGPLNRRSRHCLAASRFAVFVLRPDFAERKASEIVRAAKEKPLVNWHLTASSPLAYGRNFTVEQQDRVPRQMEILRSLQIESVNLRVTSKKATGDGGRKSNALSPAREQRIVA